MKNAQTTIVKRQIPIDKVRAFIRESSLTTKIYIGSDSTRHKVKGVWWADYTTVVVFHINGNRGCRVFGHVERERDFDQKMSRPSMRLMNEVIKTANMYLMFAEDLLERTVEIHMDISPDIKNGSSCVVNEAIGYIRGTCNIEPLTKPDGWAASYAADRWSENTRSGSQ